jgi:hypothetical protein
MSRQPHARAGRRSRTIQVIAYSRLQQFETNKLESVTLMSPTPDSWNQIVTISTGVSSVSLRWSPSRQRCCLERLQPCGVCAHNQRMRSRPRAVGLLETAASVSAAYLSCCRSHCR